MRFAQNGDHNNKHPNSNGHAHHDAFLTNSSDFGVDYWRDRLASAAPTAFPLRSASRPVIDSSTTRRFCVPNHWAHQDHGISLKAVVALAYGLVLRAHADAPSEVVFAYVDYSNRANGFTTESLYPATSFIQNIRFDWNQTVLASLKTVQYDITRSKNEHLFDANNSAIPADIASLFRTVLFFHAYFPVEAKMPKIIGVDYDLGFNIDVIGLEEIAVEARFASKSASSPEIETFLDHFEAAIKNILLNLTSLVSKVEFNSLHEQQRLITDINPTYPHKSLSHANNVSQLIEEQATKTPQKIALQVDQDQFVTYKQLDIFANDVSHTLLSHGLKRGEPVGIYMDKSCEMFIAILGIHKAGCAYVPLDPLHPSERIQTILRIANIRVVVTSKEFLSHLEAKNYDDIRLLPIDISDLSPAIKPNVLISRGDISHVLFTSGSTGTPKGVILTHGNVIESILGSREVLGPLDGRVLQFSNYTFDVSVWDWCGTFSAGGTLCVVSRRKLLDNLGGVVNNMDITFLETTPTVMTLISARSDQVPTLQMLALSGEPLTPEVRDKWADAVKLVNVYGPTEASTNVTALKWVTQSTELINIGRPFGLNVIYVLDEQLRPVPLGCVGELFIGGPQVARGYLSAPEQTAKAFVKDPFRPGSTMYASGDLVRMSPADYSLTFLGRRDTQIKIRGLRIELGEIESVLKNASRDMSNAAVIKVDAGGESLVAFLEFSSKIEIDAVSIVHKDNQVARTLIASLTNVARERLPPYMVPSTYVPVNRFPFSSSGKLDRKALTAFFYAHQDEIRDLRLDSGEGSSIEGPRDELQATIRSLWASILNVAEDLLSIDADFFTVGGDSISAIRLGSAARDAGIHLQTTDIIQNPTIIEMAQVARTTVIDYKFDDDEIPSMTLDGMKPEDLALLDIDQSSLDTLRKELLSKHGLLATDVLDIYPCTALQTSFLAAGFFSSDAYIIRQIYDLPPGSNSSRIREAFADFINHPNGTIFRTTFVLDDTTGRYLQVITRPYCKSMEMEWNTIEVGNDAALEEAIREYQFGRGCERFEPGELMTRGCIFEVRGVPRALTWSLHHALADHWSINNAEFDIVDIYFQRTLPPRRSFKPMIKYLHSLDRTASLEFWNKHLLDANPTHFPQSVPDGSRAIANTVVSRDVHADHTSFTRQFGVTAATLVTVAWSVVLAAHISSPDVVFGQVVAGRNAPIKDIDSMAGNTINTVARRVILKPEATILDTLLAIQREQTEVSKHEHIDLAELRLQGTAAASLFKTLLNFTNLPGDQRSPLDGLDFTAESHLWIRRLGSYDGQDAPFALSIIPMTADTFYIEANYNDQLLLKAEVDVILDHFESALRFMIGSPQTLVADIELINEREMELLVPLQKPAVLKLNGNTKHSHDTSSFSPQSLSRLIELQAERTPERIALQFGQEVFMTYRQMDVLSNNLAWKLIKCGIGRDELVAIYMDKSIEMFLSILAIHKAGGAYVPLDPEYPADRVNTILSLSKAVNVLTTEDLQQQLADTIVRDGIALIVVDFRNLTSDYKPDVPVTRDDLCYVMFTSGSTGIPKGVMLTHGNVIESILVCHEVLGPLNGRVLQFSNYTFDLSVWDWCGTLSAGGTLCIVPKKELMDNLGGIVDSLDITFLETTPTVIALISPQDTPTLQNLGIGGEALTVEVRNKWADEVNFANLYGPTEAAIMVTGLAGFNSSTETTNIGRPYGLNVIYILDERLRPVPLGCVGELFIGGPQVARGYLGAPEQTAKVFIKNPFRPGSIMYASGDLVRMSPIDHTITYLGRRDIQVKIRGLRIEIGEIETVLKDASLEVENAVVIKVDTGKEGLIAFLKCSSPQDSDDSMIVCNDQEIIGPLVMSLRRAVLQKLPRYMAPSMFVPVTRFPLSSSGKLDRKALTTFFYAHQEEIQNLQFDSEQLLSLEAPHDELEATLRSLWASTLNLKEDLLSIDDDFFMIGGDSISAIRLASAARNAGLSLLVTDIIRNPTVRTMAEIVRSSIPNTDYDDDETPTVTLDKMSPEDLTLLNFDSLALNSLRREFLPKYGLAASDILDVYPSTALQTSFLLAGITTHNAYISTMSWDLPPRTDAIKLQVALNDFVNHPNGMMLRTVFLFQPVSNSWLQALIRPRRKQMECDIVIVADEEELELRVSEYVNGRGSHRFTEEELLTRACVFQMDGQARVLVWTLHHALMDRWSMQNMTFDIEQIYEAHPLSLRRPFKPMIKYLQYSDRTSGIEFWRKHLYNTSPTPFLQGRSNARRVTVDTIITRKLHNVNTSGLARGFGIMPSTIIACAWALVLSSHSNTTDVVFGQVLSGRNAPIKNIGSMSGIMINTVARRVLLDPKITVLEMLQQFQSEQFEISKHESISLAEIQAEGIPVTALFNTILNMWNRGFDTNRGYDISSVGDGLFAKPRKDGLGGLDYPLILDVELSSTDFVSIGSMHASELISNAETEVVLDHFESAIRFMIDYPEKLIIDVELINDHERQLLIPGGPNVLVPNAYSKRSSYSYGPLLSVENVCQLIELQVEKTPQRIALQFDEDVYLTYKQMDSLSNDLARRLIQTGVERGNLIALYMDKSIEMFLSILAVQKAGGGYVPLDPEHPADRIHTIMTLSKARIILTTSGLRQQLANLINGAGTTLIIVDFRELTPDIKPKFQLTRNDICYVLFTSGSTGVPKGVIVTHGNVIESVLGSREVLGSLDGRVLQFSNYTFDFSVWDWCGTLSAGGTLCVVPKQRLMDNLGSIVNSLEVTFLETTPTVIALISPEEVPTLQKLACGGEALTVEVRNKWADAVNFVHVYGPTETTTVVTAMKQFTSSTETTNIGRPLGLNVIYILNERLRPVPLGCVGELFISGPQVSRGYLNASEQTAKVFISDPFRSGSTMYASGDLARISPVDYSITYLGRRDTQIKIHGLRVEIGEIEAVLKDSSLGVANAVVIKVDAGNESLVAFLEYPSTTNSEDVIIVHDAQPDVGTLITSLRRAVLQKLPRYMAPSIYVPLNRLLLSSSGKLDRKALATFFYAHQEEIRNLQFDSEQLSLQDVPQDEFQVMVRSLWASTLDLKEDLLGIDDDFFIIGGDSISAIRLAGAARNAGLSLPVTDIIRNPTVRGMALIVRSAIPNSDYDNDDTPTITLDKMRPEHLTLLTLKEDELNCLRNDLLAKYGLSASDVIDVYPPTAPQTSFLLAGMMVHEAYIITAFWDLPPNTSATQLRESFDSFVNHPNGMMLRTVFVFNPVSSKWLQVVIKPERRRLEWNVITVEDEIELSSRVSEYKENRDNQQFEDGQFLTRVCIFQLNGYARVLVWTLHHALVDHWTLEHMVADIDSLYADQPLPSRRSFKPMIKYLQEIDRGSGVEFWRKHLHDALPTLFLQNRLNVRRVTANTIIHRQIRGVDSGVLTRRYGIMPSTLMTCAWSIVLSAHSNSSDVVFGQVLSGRSAPIKDIGVMTGMMINTVARRVLLYPTATVLETLQQIQSEQLEISKHENISLAELQAEGIPVSTLFDTILNFRNKGFNKVVEQDSMDSLFAKPRTEGCDRVDYPFALNIDLDSTNGISIRAQYAAECIVEAEVDTFLNHFESALSFLINNPQSMIADVELINEEEMQLLIPPEDKTVSNITALGLNSRNFSEYTIQTVVSLIELQAGKTPQRIALQFGQDSFLTYEQMDHLSNNLARRLIAVGVEPGKLVALCMDKSIEMFLSLLAIHKAGAGYVPLDPEYPADRINTIISLSKALIVLITQDLHQQLINILGGVGTTLIIVSVRDLTPDTKPDVAITRDDVCYVMFTSGSTGIPKGVVLTHGNVIESILVCHEVLGPLNDRVLQFSNYTFDLSVWDWCGTLSAGGTLCIVPKKELMDNLSGIVDSLDITFLETTPTVMALISPQDTPTLQNLGIGGEALTVEVRNKWADEVNFANLYGPTEAAIMVTGLAGFTSSTETTNIGRPYGLNVIYILDERLRPVPLGCVGELFVSGPQVARGYLGAPEQTAKVFIDNPFRPGSVMYASGDLVRMSPIDHTITYLGRRDIQVKIRGLRIEIGEIETVLKDASLEVENAVVIKVDTGSESLVAFLEYPSASGADDMVIVHNHQHVIGEVITSMRRAVLQKLPPYMAPSVYIPLTHLPLSSSGKLDRKALATFFYAHHEEIRNLQLDSEQLSSLEVPHDELQATLRSLWALTLNLQENLLGIDDDFFVVGGDSISAIRLASAVRGAGLSLPVTDIIRNPTIRQMAQIVQSGTPGDDYDQDETPAVTLDKMLPEDLTLLDLDSATFNWLRDELLPKYGLSASDVLDVYPSTALQTGFLLTSMIAHNAYISTMSWDLSQGISAIKLQTALNDFVNHPNGMMLRTMFLFHPVSNKWLQALIRPRKKQMECDVVTVAHEEELELRISEYVNGRGSHRFTEGELLTRACIFEMDGYARVLVWTLHHALMDRWSIENMAFDVEHVYGAHPLPCRRPFKPMIKYLQKIDRVGGIEFWKKYLCGAAPTPFLQGRSNARRVTTNSIITRDLCGINTSALTRRFGIMPSTLIACAWALVLSAHSNTTDVVFGQVLSGRNAPIKNIGSMSGIMINTIARRVLLDSKITILEMLRQLQSEQIEISKHENISLSELQAESIPVNTLFNTILNLWNGGFNTSSEHDFPFVGDRLFAKPRQDGFGRLEYPLVVDVELGPNDFVSVGSMYAPELLSDTEAYVLLDHFESALRFMINHPDNLIIDVQLINDHERQLLIPTGPNVLEPNAYSESLSCSYDLLISSAQNVCQVIEFQVKKTPERIALQFNQDVYLTYRQMDLLSNNLAWKLIRRGVQRGNLITIYMDKSIEMFLSIMAIHKAGGGYVPLDPEHPADRISTIIRLSKASIVLTTKDFERQLVNILGETEVDCLTVDFKALVTDVKVDVKVSRDDICYVLFTSGSTGIPKGVILTHGNVIESILVSRQVVGPLDGRVLQFSNYTFDFSVWDWCGTLSAGGTLCVVPKQRLLDNLGGVTDSLDITTLETTPTVTTLISPEDVPTLQMLVMGGEALTPESRNRWAGNVHVINVYGPTETCVVVTALKVTLSTELTNVGRPFGLNAIYILDERLRPVPLGCAGEIFISGPQVARGYLGAPEQTAKVFVNDPFRPGIVMYASGDLARINPVDYSITYLGRRDTQIKIRGLRVEIGEIEAVLRDANPEIANAVVIKVDTGSESLVAFLEYPSTSGTDDVIVVHDNPQLIGPLITSLRRAVLQKLPRHMSPNTYVPLNRLPLSSSGKLDRKALDSYFYAHHEEIRNLQFDSEHLSSLDVPHDELQATLRSLWASTLDLKEDLLGIDDDFFVVGGDSISAIRLASAARNAGLSLAAPDIIRNPTIRKMAQLAGSIIPSNDYDDDETPTVTLDLMRPSDLTLLTLNQDELNSLRNELLPKYGLSASDILDVYPSTSPQTSFLLAGMIVHDAYIVTIAWDLPPNTSVTRLRKSFENFVDHPNGMMLRTVFVFHAASSKWLQVVIKPEQRKPEWNVVTVQDEIELSLRVSEYEQSRGSQRFKDGEFLTRACVFQLHGVARVFTWTFHHALVDHWTAEHIITDIDNIYANQPLPSRRPFKPMIKYLQQIDHASGVEFWRRHLQGALPTLFVQNRLNARRVTAKTIIHRQIRGIDANLLTRRFGIMPSTLMTCAWSIVLSAHSNTDDVAFGQVLSGRSAPIKDIGVMTGMMINTVARRVLLNPTATVLETLQQIQSEQLEISKHENISLAELQAEGIPVSTLFDTILNFRNRGFSTVAEQYPKSESLFANPREGRDRLDYPFALDIDLVSTDGISLRAHGAEYIVEAEVNTFLDHFESALHYLIGHPENLIADVELINEREKQLLIHPEEVLEPEFEAFGENTSYFSDYDIQTVISLIEHQAEKTPQRIALQFGQDVFMTYEQMDGLSNNLARKLIAVGVKPGKLVALYMDKSIEMFLSILAIHKSGGGYVPLDPEHPADRINTIIRLSNVAIVLTSSELDHQLLIDKETRSMVVDHMELFIDTKPVVRITRDDISHVLFTSGSTGVPKGVVLTHGSVLASILGSLDVICRLDGRVLQFCNYTFDLSVWDWACTLSGGGTLCVAPKQKLIDDLSSVAKSFDVTFMQTTPTVAALTSPEEVPSLQTLLLGGEVLSHEIRNTWAGAVILINGYGPTEASTYVAAMKQVTLSTGLSNIGRPFGLNVTYVLDERLRPVPLGCIGELFIGGPQVARGYLGSPEQTAKVFVSDPFRPGSTMYASGDLARVSPIDHTITYLGRRDTQIKIRGQRVEIGEIEAVLRDASPDISNAAVIKVEAGGESLMAFLECSPGSNIMDGITIVQENEQFIATLVASLRRVAQQRLASYMVPTVFVPLHRFPLSSSGKLDRNALTAFYHAHKEKIRGLRLDSEIFATLSSLEIPQNELQATLRTLWASILNLTENVLSIDDDFFLVGGDSVSAIRLASAVRDAGLFLPVADIFRNPTIRKMAQVVLSVIPNDDYDNDETLTVTLDKMSPEDLTLLNLNENELEFLRTDVLSNHGLLSSDVQDVYPATPTQIAHLLAGATGHNAYIVPLAWHLPPKTDVKKLQKTFDAFIDQPNGMMLRTVFLFHPVLKKWLQALLRPGAKRMEWETITIADERELDLRVPTYMLSRGMERFDYKQLLCRACIFQLDGYARALVFTIHHALMDMWSMENITSDIERIYTNHPAPPRRSFKPMIKYLQRDGRAKDIDFWKRHLRNASPTRFPHDRSVTMGGIMYRDIHVDHISLVRRFGIMQSTLITCAWSVVLSLHGKSTDVVFGHILSGRNAPVKDIGTMCGVMINTVPRRVLLNPDATVLETLQQIQSDQLEISKHENIGLTELEEEGVPVSTLFHSVLNFRNNGVSHVIEHEGSPIENRLLRPTSYVRKAVRGVIEYPLGLDIDLHPKGVISSLSYASEFISEAEAQSTLDQFGSALQFMINYPDRTTYELISDWTMRKHGTHSIC